MNAILKTPTPQEGVASAQLGEVVDINPRFGKNELADDTLVSFVPMKCVEEESGRFVPLGDRKVGDVRKGYTAFRDGDVIFAKVTPCMENGKAAVVSSLTNGIGFGSTEFFVLRPSQHIDSKYLLHFILQQSFRKEAARNMTGAVGLRRVPKSWLEQQQIPLPPIAAQRQIVAEIEKQFTRLDAGVAALRRVQANLKRYRAAVLKAACEGRLVPTESNLWREMSLSELLHSEDIFNDGDWVESKDQDPDGEVRLIQLADVGDGTFRNRSNRFLTKAKAIDLGCTFLKRGDILVARMPDPLGRACIFPGVEQESVTVVDVCIVRSLERHYDSRWLMHTINSSGVRAQISALQAGSTRKRISRKNLSTIRLRVPPLAEQACIIAEVERRLRVIEELEATVAANLQRATRLRQSILQRAFDGGVG